MEQFCTAIKVKTHSYKAFVLEHVLETFLDKLVSPTNEIKIVYVIELQRAKLFVIGKLW